MRTNRVLRVLIFVAISAAVLGGIVFSFPTVLVFNLEREQVSAHQEQFPVSVDPKNKRIVENERVKAFLGAPRSPLQAAAADAAAALGVLFEWFALSVDASPAYQSLAAAAGTRLVAIMPGMRKEQVVDAFGKALGWSSEEKKAFLAPKEGSELPFPEGSFLPGIYSVGVGAPPVLAQKLVNERFTREVLSRYGPEVAEAVPLRDALIIASLIEREAAGLEDMRLVSGVIWNRLFIGMKLQIDATLQYAKANALKTVAWWPRLLPKDQFRSSPYNTYLHTGLPPAPIANPSVASVVAALNPVNTSCLFYFHDSARRFHCSDTYAEHVALLKKFYGRGK